MMSPAARLCSCARRTIYTRHGIRRIESGSLDRFSRRWCYQDILLLRHDSRILRQSSNHVCGSWKSQASSPWAKQHRATEKPHTGLDDCLRLLQAFFRNSLQFIPLFHFPPQRHIQSCLVMTFTYVFEGFLWWRGKGRQRKSFLLHTNGIHFPSESKSASRSKPTASWEVALEA